MNNKTPHGNIRLLDIRKQAKFVQIKLSIYQVLFQILAFSSRCVT